MLSHASQHNFQAPIIFMMRASELGAHLHDGNSLVWVPLLVQSDQTQLSGSCHSHDSDSRQVPVILMIRTSAVNKFL